MKALVFHLLHEILAYPVELCPQFAVDLALRIAALHCDVCSIALPSVLQQRYARKYIN